MKRTPLKRGTSQLKRSGFKRKLFVKKIRVKRTSRSKKMELRRLIVEQYNLPNLLCKRYGTSKAPTRQDILKGMLWNVFSRYIRQRDAGKCIACGAFKTYEELQAGHYAPAGGNDLELLFMEENVNGEDSTCNADFEGGGWHLVGMRKNMITKYGIEKVEEIDRLKDQKRAIKWEESVYVEKILYYHGKLSTGQL